MIWGLEGRHTWVPSGLANVYSPQDIVDGVSITNLRAYVLSLTPSLYWVLNATYGGDDQSTNNRDAEARGGLTVGTGPSLTADPNDSSTDLDGANHWLSQTSPGYNPFVNGQALTVVGLLQRDTQTSHDPVVAADDIHVAPALYLSDSTVGDVLFDPDISEGLLVNLGDNPIVGEPTSFAFTFNEASDQVGWWLNGTPRFSGTTTDNYNALPGRFEVGHGPSDLFGTGANRFFDGKVAHIAVFERILTPTEIANYHYFATTYPPLVPLQLNRKVDDSGARIYPQHRLSRIGGLSGTGESGDIRDLRVGSEGEIPRRSFRRGKTITYEGDTIALTRQSLRSAEAAIRLAMARQGDEGFVVVQPHPTYDASGDFRYYSARALTAEIDDVAISPFRRSRGHQSKFVIALRNAGAGGFAYYDQDDVGYP